MEQEADFDEVTFVIDSNGNGNDSHSATPLNPAEEKEEESDTWKDADFLSFGNPADESHKKNRTEHDGQQQIKDAIVGDNHENKIIRNESEKNDPYVTSGSGPGLIPNISCHTNTLPPWMARHPDVRYRGRTVAPLVALHNEIIDFAKLMMPQDYEIESREEIANKVKQVAEATFGVSNCDVIVFGSQATKLFLPTSDIDMVINFKKKEQKPVVNDSAPTTKSTTTDDPESNKAKETREMEEWDVGIPSGSPLRRFADALQQTWKNELSYLEVLENTRIPLVKFTHGPTNMSVDVSFDLETGPQAAELMNQFVEQMPPLRPLIFVLKYFMSVRALNEPYTGGMGSFMLQMMIVSFLQHRAREEYCNYKRSIVMNLGSLLLEFFELYGLDFNYFTTGISVREDGSYFPKGASEKRDVFFQISRPTSLAIENPLDPTADVGRSTFRLNQIQRSFEVAFRVLLAHVSVPILPAVSILASVLPPSEELRKRAIIIQATYPIIDVDDDGDSNDGDNTALCSGGNRKHKKKKGGKKRNRSSQSSVEEDHNSHSRKKSRKKEKKRQKGQTQKGRKKTQSYR